MRAIAATSLAACLTGVFAPYVQAKSLTLKCVDGNQIQIIDWSSHSSYGYPLGDLIEGHFTNSLFFQPAQYRLVAQGLPNSDDGLTNGIWID